MGLMWRPSLVAACVLLPVFAPSAAEAADPPVLSGAAAYGDFTRDAPGVRRHLTLADLPSPYATAAAANSAHLIRRPAEVLPKVPPGFAVELLASGFDAPRLLRTAPNGDVFVAGQRDGSIHLLRQTSAGSPAKIITFAEDLDTPFGIAFYPPGPEPRYIYIGTIGAVLRFPYRNGDEHASGKGEIIIPHLPDGGHSTRDVIFSADGRKMFVSVGSASNDQEGRSDEELRANVLEFNPDGTGMRRFATGIRNPVGLALHPVTGDLWTAVNERDGLGDNLPPDYVTQVKENGFYGWPWFYIGAHQDPRHKGEHADLAGHITVPDVLIQPHSAPLQLAFYGGNQFPPDYRNNLFVALHGSWNRAQRTGYKLIRVPLRDGRATGEYEDFMTGFVTPEGSVWGRPVGVAVTADGALLVSDDTGGTIWRISYTGSAH